MVCLWSRLYFLILCYGLWEIDTFIDGENASTFNVSDTPIVHFLDDGEIIFHDKVKDFINEKGNSIIRNYVNYG